MKVEKINSVFDRWYLVREFPVRYLKSRIENGLPQVVASVSRNFLLGLSPAWRWDSGGGWGDVETLEEAFFLADAHIPKEFAPHHCPPRLNVKNTILEEAK